MPGTVVIQALRALIALPIPYLYSLKEVSQAYQPTNADGQEKGYRYLPKYGFGWEHSNQVAFERIHDVWNNKEFVPNPRDPGKALTPQQILEAIRKTILDKLRATDTVIRRLKIDYRDQLRLRKEPFRLYDEFDPLDFQMLGALRTFSMLETSIQELSVKVLHSLPVADRTAKFECIQGLRYQDGMDEVDGSLWFTFDPGSRDAKFDEQDFYLVVTPEDEPEKLIGDVDNKLFNSNRNRTGPYEVVLKKYDYASSPPRILLMPKSSEKFREKVNLHKPCALDGFYADYNTPKVLEVLNKLDNDQELFAHIHELLHSFSIQNWQPFIDDVAEVENRLLLAHSYSISMMDSMPNEKQMHAIRGVYQEPLSMIWGPPGTGKTYIIAEILLGYYIYSQISEKPVRILITAFTHHAINNVLMKLVELSKALGFSEEDFGIFKAHGTHINPADKDLPDRVSRLFEEDIPDRIQSETPCLIIGSTVWSVYKAMKKNGGVNQPLFDVILIDEASQMKLPDALIAFSASKHNTNIILAGDDKQLPPIIMGKYPDEQEYMLSSVFAFMRSRMEERTKEDPKFEEQVLFQLEENFRMNEPLTAYPRDVLYRGRFFSKLPGIRISTTLPLKQEEQDFVEFLLHPERPVLLCWYEAPRSFTARNPIEAQLIGDLTVRLSQVLKDPKTGEVYTSTEFAAQGVAALSPHRAQNSTIRNVLRNCGFDTDDRPLPLVDTVDKLQGQERDVVLVSYGVADGEYAEAEAEFLLSSNRFNVAATRARHKLIVFASSTVLDVVPNDQKILLDSMMLKEFRSFCSDGHIQFPWQSPEFGEIILHVQWKGF